MKRKSMLALLLAVSMTCSMTAATGTVAFAEDAATEEYRSMTQLLQMTQKLQMIQQLMLQKLQMMLPQMLMLLQMTRRQLMRLAH